jgi:ankyrin repeat protein
MIQTMKLNIEEETADGWTPLIYCAFNGFQSCLEYLLRNTAKINHQDRLKRTALHWAMRCNQAEMAGTLVKMGADYELVDFESKKAVDLAMDAGHRDLAQSIQQMWAQQKKSKAAPK